MIKLLVAACLACISYTISAQSASTFMGARTQGLAYASACLSDEWSIFNNVGGLAKINQVTTAFTYNARPGIAAFNTMAAVVAIPAATGVAGVGIFRFGDDLYNEQVITAGFSNAFGLASLGASIKYIQYSAEGFGTKGVLSFDFGGIASLTPKISIGAHIVNITQPSITEDDERLPTILAVGIAFTPSDKLLVTTEIEKDLDYSPTWKAGLEYKFYKKFWFRTGFNLQPNAGFIGFGFKPQKFVLDYAFMQSFDQGSRHQATVAYRLKAKRS